MSSQSGWVETDEQDETYNIRSDWGQAARALMGSLLIIGIMLCSVYCLYKYAVCQEKKEKRNGIPKKPRTITVKEYDMV
jgi:hypothetical protein